MAAKKLGLVDVPCTVARGWSDAQKRAYVIADNKLALNAGWDEAMLKVELADLKAMDFDATLMGFSPDEIAALTPGTADPIGAVPGGAYKEQFGVTVVCGNEAEQRALYERLNGEGLNVKVVTV